MSACVNHTWRSRPDYDAIECVLCGVVANTMTHEILTGPAVAAKMQLGPNPTPDFKPSHQERIALALERIVDALEHLVDK